MNKFTTFALLATAATLTAIPAAVFAAETQPVQAATSTAAAAPVAINAGRMIYGPNGSRIAAAYRVTSDGNVQIILNSKLITIPASSLSEVEGKVVTTLTKRELGRLR